MEQDWEAKEVAHWKELWSPYLTGSKDENGDNQAHCPVHKDHDPSAMVNFERGVWHCFSCSAGGAIDRVAIMLGSRKEADFVPPWVNPGKRARATASRSVTLPSDEQIEGWHEDLMEDPDALDYITFYRGIKKDEVAKRKIIMRPDRTSGVCYGFPVFNLNEELVNVRWYAPKNVSRNIRKRVWSVKGHGGAALYPIDVLVDSDEVCVVEGEFDAVLLNAWGVPAVTSTAGAGKSGKRWRKEWNELFEGKTVFIIPDRDVPGVEYGEYIRKQLQDHADDLAVVELPFPIKEDHGDDVSEFLLREKNPELSIEELQRLLRRSFRESRDYLLSRDPEVRKQKRALRLRMFAEKSNRREDVLDNWDEPSSTLNMREELAKPRPPEVWTIDQLHLEDSNTIISSLYKVGKSTLLLNLMRALADSRPFLGLYEVHQPDGGIAFWNYEVSPNQFNRWFAEAKVKDVDRCSVWHLRGESLPLDVEEIFERAVLWLLKHEVSTLIIDPYSRAYSGDENDNSEVNAWLDMIDRLKNEAGVKDLFMSVHHGRSGEDRVRGATRLEDWPDSIWRLVKENGDRYFYANGRDVDVPESKLSFDPSTRGIKIVGGNRQEERINMLVEKVTSIVHKHPGARTFQQLVTDMTGNGTSADRTTGVNRAIEMGLIALDTTTTPPRLYPTPKLG